MWGRPSHSPTNWGRCSSVKPKDLSQFLLSKPFSPSKSKPRLKKTRKRKKSKYSKKHRVGGASITLSATSRTQRIRRLALMSYLGTSPQAGVSGKSTTTKMRHKEKSTMWPPICVGAQSRGWNNSERMGLGCSEFTIVKKCSHMKSEESWSGRERKLPKHGRTKAPMNTTVSRSWTRLRWKIRGG